MFFNHLNWDHTVPCFFRDGMMVPHGPIPRRRRMTKAPKQTSRFDLNGFGEKLGGDVATLVAAAQHLGTVLSGVNDDHR